MTLIKNRPCCEPFSATGAELGGHEYGYGLAAEVEDALLGEPREGAERASREMPVASAISCRLKEGSKTTPRLVTRPSSVARFSSILATLCGALRKTRSPTRSSSSRVLAASALESLTAPSGKRP